MSRNKNVVTTDLKYLKNISEPVDLTNKDLTTSISNALHKAFHELDGKIQGIASIQLKLPYRAVLLRYKKGADPIVIFNPNVLMKLGLKSSLERCASEHDILYRVKRPLLVKVEYYYKDGEKVTKWLSYKKARIFMHEYDHLNGILLKDHGIRIG